MKKKVVILGAGIAGLSAGYFLARSQKYNVTIVENSAVTGGMCASFRYKDFVLDYGAHKLYSVIPGVLSQIREVMGEGLIELPKKNRIYLRGHLLDYPLKMGNLMKVMGMNTFFTLGVGYAVSLIKGIFQKRAPQSYEEYMIKYFGKPAYKLVFEPLADKVWGKPAELHPEMARTRVPSSNGLEIIFKLLGVKKESSDTNAENFYYPRGGFGDWPEKLKKDIEAKGGSILTNTSVQNCKYENANVSSITVTNNGTKTELPCDCLISTIPLPVLSRYVFSNNGHAVSYEADRLEFRHLILVYVFVKRPIILEDQWIFFPEREYIFGRIFEQKQMNPQLAPKDQTSICCDFTCDEKSWQWQADDKKLIEECVRSLVKAGFIKAEEVVDAFVKRQRNFYPRYDLLYLEKMAAVGKQLKQVKNLLLTGRLGMYNYNNSDHCFDMGRFIGERLEKDIEPSRIWEELEEHVRSYKIVD